MSERGPRLIVGGSINTDLVATVRKAPGPGETVTGSRFEQFPGGKGANQAVAACRFGASVVMLGGVGNDEFGASRVRDLEHEGIDTSNILVSDDASSGVALIVVEESGENRIAYVPGASWSVQPDDAEQAIGAGDFDAVLATLELPHDALGTLFRAGRETGIPVICNATPEPSEGTILVSIADALIVNESEALELLGIDEAVGGWTDVGRALLELGPSCVVITLGSAGALVLTSEGEEPIPAPAVQVVDTTGAGDAFCGAFATAFAEHRDPVAAAQVAVVAGSLAVTRSGAQPSMPSAKEIQDASR